MIAQKLEIAGQRMVVLTEADYDRLCARAREVTLSVPEEDLPPYPPADAKGNYPAVEYGRVTLARSLIRDRRAVGLTQSQLAQLAGTRQETVSRVESGKYSASTRMIDRLYRAIEGARKKKRQR